MRKLFAADDDVAGPHERYASLQAISPTLISTVEATLDGHGHLRAFFESDLYLTSALDARLPTSSFLPRNPAGSILTPQLSPTQSQEVSYISGVDSSGVIVATSYDTFESGSSTQSNVAKWGAGIAGTAGGTVTYYFEDASSWTATEKTVFVAAFTLWSDVANIHFAEAANSGMAQITITRGTAGSGAFYSSHFSGDGGAGTVGTTDIFHMTPGTLNIDTTTSGFGPISADPNVTGGYAWGTIVHEQGHALGLGHAGPYNGGVSPATQQFSAQDNLLWTVMSYIDPKDATAKYFAEYTVTGTSWGTSADGFARSPTTVMALDILAAQQLYGLPVTTAFNGGQIFGFNCNVSDATKPFFDFTVNTHPIVTLWDMGANNTLDLSGFATASSVNLNPGTFSSCSGMVNNIAIAFSTTIDTAIGGAGNDFLRGNSHNNLLNGGAGIDTAVFTGSHTNYTVVYDSLTQNVTVTDQRGGSPDGADTLIQIEQYQFSDGVFTFNTTGQVLSQAITNGDGSKTVTLFDPLDGSQWATQVSSFDPLGTLVTRTTNYDSGAHWVESYDVTNATAVRWSLADFDAGNNQTSLLVTNDNRTHTLTIFDVANAYAWANVTISYDASWNQTGVTATRDDGSHTISFSEVAPALELLLWYTRPFYADVNGVSPNLVLTGSNESDVMFGFDGNDVLNGGNGDDLFSGGLGADTITTGPGAGVDVVMFTSVAELTGTSYDWITDFNANVDLFDMPGAVTGIDQPVTNATLSTASFDGDMSGLVNAAHLASHHVVRVLVTAGSLAGHQFMVIDANGVAGYQTGEDFVFDTTGSTFTNLALSNFI